MFRGGEGGEVNLGDQDQAGIEDKKDSEPPEPEQVATVFDLVHDFNGGYGGVAASFDGRPAEVPEEVTFEAVTTGAGAPNFSKTFYGERAVKECTCIVVPKTQDDALPPKLRNRATTGGNV